MFTSLPWLPNYCFVNPLSRMAKDGNKSGQGKTAASKGGKEKGKAKANPKPSASAPAAKKQLPKYDFGSSSTISSALNAFAMDVSADTDAKHQGPVISN